MIPLVILDLDGTIIGSSGQVLPCVWQGVEKLHKAGVKLAVCTGRPDAGVARRVAERLGPRNPHIFNNGALVTYPGGDTLHVTALREATITAMVGYARDLGLVLEVYTPTAMYVERKTTVSEAHAKMIAVNAIVSDLLTVARNEPVVRAQWLLGKGERDVVEKLPISDVELSFATSPALPDIDFINVTRAGVSKGSAVRQLAEAMRIPLADIMGVGDSEGDVPMLEAVGHPVVMAGAPEAVRARFGQVAGQVDDCGVLPAFEEALLLKPVPRDG
jgi:Cof subfamily protein (haloacid dehalogenase superfamily)